MSILVRKAEKLSKKNDFESAYKLLVLADAKGNAEASYALGTWHLFGRYVKKDFHKAVSFLQKAAKKGNTDALFDLAICYETGRGVSKSLGKAYKFYFQAFLSGDYNAAYELGRMYYYGLGVTKDKELADSFISISERRKLPAYRPFNKSFIIPLKARSFEPAE